MGSTIKDFSLPNRPRFSWDIRNVPWTDGKGSQEDYKNSVDLWSAFHDALPNTNANKLPIALRGIMLQSSLYGRAKEICRKVPDEVIRSAEGKDAIVNALHKRDALSTVSAVYQDFVTLLNVRRGENESFRNYESRFEAKVSKFRSHGDSCDLPDALTAFMLLSNSSVDNTQRISVLAAAVPQLQQEEGEAVVLNTAHYLSQVSYDSVASVLRQCDAGSSTKPTITASTASTTTRRTTGRRTLNASQLADLKNKSTCHKCKKMGHWKSDHNRDGSLKPGVKSFDQPSSDTRIESSRSNRTVTFNMCHITNHQELFDIEDNFVGPLLDDGAPYSGIGMSELQVLAHIVLPDWNNKLDPLPSTIASRPYWQYGTGEHSSDARKILGSVMLQACDDYGDKINIRHLVIDGSSQWVIGRNVTKHCDIQHIGGQFLNFPNGSKISLIERDMHSYIKYENFSTANSSKMTLKARTGLCISFFCATAKFPAKASQKPWKEVKKIIDKVHKHVCGHASFSDIRTLLKRNELWNQEIEKYVVQVIDVCTNCSHTSQPSANRKVSLSSLSRSFNELVCIDHVHLNEMRVIHMMDATTRYSVGAVVPDTSMKNAIINFESLWISPFWEPKAVQFDQAFDNSIFKNYLLKHDIEGRPIPARRHNKNVLESKHRVIRDVFLRLMEDNDGDINENAPPELIVQESLRICNDLYGNDVMSSHELAKGYTRPIHSSGPILQIPDEIKAAHDTLIAKRKMNLIMKSHATVDTPVAAGDLVQVFIKKEMEKRGKWSSPRPILSFDKPSGIVTVPGSNGKVIKAAIEDTRHAIYENALAKVIQEAIDNLTIDIEDSMDNIDHSADDDSCERIIHKDSETHDLSDDDNGQLMSIPSIGEKIEVYWPLEAQFYPGTVNSIEDDKVVVHYDDGDTETLEMEKENWRYPHITSNRASLDNFEMKSSEAEVLKQYHRVFGYKDFMAYQAQGLPDFPLHNAYHHEQMKFKVTVKEINVKSVPSNANVITSHVIYKVKANDDGSLKMKARIAPHGNKDRERQDLKTDSATCPPTGIRILLSIASLMKWPLAKIDFTSAFLQTGNAERDVYVVPPRECGDRSNYWLLLTAAYGLVNANAKWQKQSDDVLRSFGFNQLVYVPQVFFAEDANNLTMLAVKVVDDILFAGIQSKVRNVIHEIKGSYSLGTVVYGPGTFLFFGLNISQDTDMSISVDADEKLNSYECYPISRLRRKEVESNLTALEMKSFSSVNSSLGWLGIAASPFCAFYSSYLQQQSSNPTVYNLIAQINSLRLLKKYGTCTSYKRPEPGKQYTFDVSHDLMVFSQIEETCKIHWFCRDLRSW